jgi:hypothetical protein
MGHRVKWDPWSRAMQSLCRPSRFACTACGHLGAAITTGLVVPDDGQRAMRRITAVRCDRCLTVEFVPLDPDRDAGVSLLLCDGCDVLAAAGSTDEEARASLTAMGGWSGGADADWDLCPTCAPSPDEDATVGAAPPHLSDQHDSTSPRRTP